MVSSPELIFVVLAPFANMFFKPVWQHVQILLTGAIIVRSAIQGDRVQFSRQEWETLLDQLAAVA